MDPTKHTKPPSAQAAPQDARDSDDSDDEGPSLETMKALSRQVQRAPTTAAPGKIIIPKRGEKDFEPLDETVTIQEKMLRESRRALFDGLSGVRGTSSKNISHATMTSVSPFAQVQVVRGNLFLTMGHTIRPPPASRSPASAPASSSSAPDSAPPPANTSTMELLPEEALYLLERGTMQIWSHPSAYPQDSSSLPLTSSSDADGTAGPTPEWDDDLQGFKDTVEMSVMEGFSTFIGMQGLTLERYQVYAGLKRLGYTVQRTERFLPTRFRKQETVAPVAAQRKMLDVSSTVGRVGMALRLVGGKVMGPFRWLFGVLRGLMGRLFGRSRGEGEGSLLGTVNATGYGALYEKLRIIPSGHSHPSSITRPPTENPTDSTDPYESLLENPYLPFFHVWKPATHWTRGKWDRGSAEGLRTLPPDFWIGVVDARSVPFPTLPQMEEIFPVLPALPTPMVRPRGTTAPSKPGAVATPTAEPSLSQRIRDFFHLGVAWSKPLAAPPLVNTFLALKQGDRSLIVAVVDGGNVGWTRLGRGGFEEHVMVPNEML